MQKMKNKIAPGLNSFRYMLVLLAGISLLLILGGYLYYSSEEKSITKSRHEEIKAIADMKIGQIRQWRNERIADAEVSIQTGFFATGIRQWIENSHDKRLEHEIMNLMQSLRKRYAYEDIILSSVDGEFLLAANPGENKIDRVTVSEIMKAAKSKNIVMTDFYYCPSHRKIHLDIIAPVTGNQGNNIAALVFRTDPGRYLYPLIQSWPTPSKTSETLLVRKDGDSALYLNELRLQKNTALRLRIPLTRKDLPAVQAILGFKGTFEGDDYRGVPVLSYIGPVADTPWYLVAKVDKSEIYAELKYRAVVITLFIFVLIVLTGVGFALIFKLRQKKIYRELLNKEKELRVNQEEYKATLYSIGEAVITTDINGAISHMNPVAEQLTGWREEEAKGRQIDQVFRIINGDSQEPIDNPVDKVLQKGLITGFANYTLLIAKDGIETPVSGSGAPLKNRSGEITGVVVVFRDQKVERAARKMLAESESRYRRLFESAKDGILILDAGNGQIVDVNPFIIELLGCGFDDLLGKDFWEIGLFKNIAVSKEAFLELQNKKYIRFDDILLETRDGRSIHVDFISSVYKVDQKSVVQFNIRDITERRQILEELSETKDYLENLINYTNAPIIVWDKDLKITRFNKAFERITGRTSGEVTGKEINILFPNERAQQSLELIKTTSSGERWEMVEMDIEHADGTVRPVLWNSANIYDPEKKEIIATIAQGHDISELSKLKSELELLVEMRTEELEEKIQKLHKSELAMLYMVEDLNRMTSELKLERHKLKDANKELEAFTYSVSHDLRAPLRAMDGFAGMLLEDYSSSLDNEGKRLLRVITDNAKKMGKLIDDLLQFSRLNRQDIRYTEIDMRAMADAVYHELAKDDGLEKISFLLPDIPMAYSDPSLIRQVWMNLISNAIKFSSRKENRIIEIGSQTGENETIFFVKDNGAGFDMAYANKLYGVFQRLHLAADFEGTGVGLAIVKQIVHRMKGRVWAEGKVNEGAAFYFSLPEHKSN